MAEIICGGFGGQGILTTGMILANIGVDEGLEVSWSPSYGSEMRGGTANCSVILSDDEVGSPKVTYPDYLVVMNLPSLTKFQSMVVPGGTLFINSSLVPETASRDDIKVIEVPANEKASELGNERASNIVMLSAILKETGIVKEETVRHEIEKTFSGRKAKFLPANLAALKSYLD